MTPPGILSSQLIRSGLRGTRHGAFSVRVADFSDAPVPGVGVTLSLGSIRRGSLSGTLTAVSDSNGLAWFNDVSTDRGGYGYSLTASAPGFAAVVSTPFDVIGFSDGPVFGTGRVGFTMTKLDDGRILLTGGRATSGGPCLNTAELYNPVAGTIAPLNMVAARSHHTATLLPDGSVLLAGGACGGAALATAERYLPIASNFEATFAMAAARGDHTATRLPDGTVLVAGGSDPGVGALSSAEVYRLGTGWTTVGPRPTPAWSAAAVLLGDGRVLISGGTASAGGISASASL